MKINDNKIVDGLMPDGSYQDRVDVQGQERAGTGIMANTFNQIIREFQDNYILKAGLIPLSDDLGQLYKATQYFINQSLEPAVASLEQKLIDTRALRIGEMSPWAGTIETIPINAYYCDGALALIEDHQLCFKAIGHSWSNGKTAPTGYFYLPDGRGVVLKGAGQSEGYTYNEDRGIVGSKQNTAIKRLLGYWDYILTHTSSSSSGVLKHTVMSEAYSGITSGDGIWSNTINLDSDFMYPSGETNRDNNIAVNWIIFVN